MRAAVTKGGGTGLELTELPEPMPGPGELLLRVRACGICGSDLHLEGLPFPGLVLGHELCGEVVGVGEGVGDWADGDRAAGFPVFGCGACDLCAGGFPSKCLMTAQVGLQRPGAFAEMTVVPAATSVKLPSSIDDVGGALVEPLAVAHHAIVRAAPDAGEPVLVLGAGPVGLAVALWARTLGARDVVLSDPVAARRDLAVRLGATTTVDPRAEDVRLAFERATGAAPKTVIECVGVPGLIQHAVDVAAIDGRVTVVGVCMAEDTMAPITALLKELEVRYCLYYRTSDFTAAADALHRGLLDPTPLVTDVVGLDDLPPRFEALKTPTTEGKLVLRP